MDVSGQLQAPVALPPCRTTHWIRRETIHYKVFIYHKTFWKLTRNISCEQTNQIYHNYFHKIPSLIPKLNQINPIRTHTSCSTGFILILSSCSHLVLLWSLISSRFPTKFCSKSSSYNIFNEHGHTHRALPVPDATSRSTALQVVIKISPKPRPSVVCGWRLKPACRRLRLKCDGTRAQTRFRLSAKWTSPFKSAWASVQPTTGRRAVRISLLVQACVLQSCDTCWLPTPFSCLPFTSPPVRHLVPSHFNWILPPNHKFSHLASFVTLCVSTTLSL